MHAAWRRWDNRLITSIPFAPPISSGPLFRSRGFINDCYTVNASKRFLKVCHHPIKPLRINLVVIILKK